MADFNEIKGLVIQELGRQEMRPTELLDLLGKQYPDAAIKEVVLGLLREGRIEMSADRQLRVLADAA
jgi:hypothetical protein